MITLTKGEYSDYRVIGLVYAAKRFNLQAFQEEWLEENTLKYFCPIRYVERREVTKIEFLPWLVKKGLVEDVDYLEVHTGCYGKAEITWWHND